MSEIITLRPITTENFNGVVKLEVHEHQRNYLASNVYSIAQTSLNSKLCPRVIYADETLVGFIMYAHPEKRDQEPGCYSIWRFMIDKRYQQRGFGKKALALTLLDMQSKPDMRKIFITYLPTNMVAKAFYAAMGFQELGIDQDSGEMEAVLLPLG